jgi:hypothetical protein
MGWNIQSRPTPTLYEKKSGFSYKFFSALRSSLSVVGSVLRSPISSLGSYSDALTSSLAVVASVLHFPFQALGAYASSPLASTVSVVASVLRTPFQSVGSFSSGVKSSLSLNASSLRLALIDFGSYTTPHVSASFSLISSTLA